MFANGTDPTFKRCKFLQNKDAGIIVNNAATGKFIECESSNRDGQGMVVDGKGANPTVTNCKFSGSRGSGIVVLNGATGTFSGCESFDNALTGFEVRGKESNPKVEKSKFYDGGKSWGGDSLSGMGSPVIMTMMVIRKNA